MGGMVDVTGAAFDWESGNGYRWAPLATRQPDNVGFTLMSPVQIGLNFQNQLAQDRSIANQVYLNGSGIAAGDVDGDGRCDLFFSGLDNDNRLYRNLGEWRFEDITESAGVAAGGRDCTGTALVDLDGDGDLDILVNTIGDGTLLFVNDGTGRFQDQTAESGLEIDKASMSMALGDLNGDGLPDLYITNYQKHALRDRPNTRFRVREVSGELKIVQVDGRSTEELDLQGRYQLRADGTIQEFGETDDLFRNLGGNRFERIPFNTGDFLDEEGKALTREPTDWGLSVMFRDINQDGLPDLYVCNDFESPDHIWINQGHGTFRAISMNSIRQTSLFSMGVDFGDINRDGFDDFFLADMLSRDFVSRHLQKGDSGMKESPPNGTGSYRNQAMRNMLLLNRGDGSYAEIAYHSGVHASEWSWTPIFLDVDLDGYEDLIVTNGHERDALNIDISHRIDEAMSRKNMSRREKLELRKAFPRLAVKNLVFRNTGQLQFVEFGEQWGFQETSVSHGAALADLDNDGDMDLVVNNLNQDAFVYRNDSQKPVIAIRLKPDGPNTRGIGARIEVTNANFTQSQEIICGGRYLSSDQPQRSFAVIHPEQPIHIKVKWPNGGVTHLEDVKAGRIYEIQGISAPPSIPDSSPKRLTVFKDVSPLIHHRHGERIMDTSGTQPSIFRQMNRMGPGVAWFDVNHDGWDDLLIGSGIGGKFSAFANDQNGGFRQLTGLPYGSTLRRNQSSLLGWVGHDGGVQILVGNIESVPSPMARNPIQFYRLNRKMVSNLVTSPQVGKGTMCMADIDGDSDLDLFVGGKWTHGRYPEKVDSQIFLNQEGKFRLDPNGSQVFKGIGMVNGSVFSDLDRDGDPDLVLAMDMGSLRILINDRGHFQDRSEQFGIDSYIGFWNGIATGDFNEDGRPDIVATNWGSNHAYQEFSPSPLIVYYGDLAENGVLEIFSGFHSESEAREVSLVGYTDMQKTFPGFMERFSKCRDYAETDLRHLLKPWMDRLKKVKVNHMTSSVFLSGPEQYKMVPLPFEVQTAPAFGCVVSDFNSDGHQDVFVSQNFSGVRHGASRLHAGTGALLFGDGRGSFRVVSAAESGLSLFGEGRGCTVSDFNQDGRVDLMVGQNNDESRLFLNQSNQAGIRFRVVGDSFNPHGIGTRIQVVYRDGRLGPVQEIQAGSGYWSMNSVVLQLPQDPRPEKIIIHLPGKPQQIVAFPDIATEIVIHQNGRINAHL